jgi:hypothetical protein
MRFFGPLVCLAFLAATATPAHAIDAGSYLCTVERKAGVSTSHLEGAGLPETFASSELYRFRIVVTSDAGRFRIVEAPYDGPERSAHQWEDDNSTLHGAYVGDGHRFTSETEPGFLVVGPDRWGSELQYYHAGHEYAGGEDKHVSVHWGRCTRERS